MAVDFDTSVYGPIHAMFGRDATIDLGSTSFWINVIDKTRGVEVQSKGDVGLFTVRPAVFLRATDLVGLGYAPESLEGGLLTVNGHPWDITSVQVAPNSQGDTNGRVILWLKANEAQNGS